MLTRTLEKLPKRCREAARLCLHIGKSLLPPTTNLNVNIPRLQGVGFYELSTWLNFIAHKHGEHTIGLDGIVNLYPQQDTHGGVHCGFPELLGVHFAQAFVTLAAGGAFGLSNEPGHGFPEVVDFLFLLAFAFAARHFGALAQQALEGFGGFAQCGVVGTMNKVLGEYAALDVAVQAAADAQNRFVGARIKFACHFGIGQEGLQRGGRGFGVRHGVEVQGHAVSNGAQCERIQKVSKPTNHCLG